jgi:hypothetical protein
MHRVDIFLTPGVTSHGPEVAGNCPAAVAIDDAHKVLEEWPQR